MTTAQTANLNSARRLAADRIGLKFASGEFNTAAIPYEKREAFATELARIITAYPDRFDPVTVATARRELGDRPNEPLADVGPASQLSDFVGEVGAQAERVGEAVAGIGEGAITTAKLARWAIPAAALVALFIVLRNFSRRTS